MDLDPELAALLLDEFPARVVARGGPAIELPDWRAMATAAALQRLMQALGAYSFLGHVKQRRIFLDFIPAARHRLEAVLRRVERVAGRPASPPNMPRLQAVLASLPD